MNLVDRDGKFVDTVWDIANVLYDAGSAIYYNAQGDDASAKEAMLDLGMDVTAMLIP